MAAPAPTLPAPVIGAAAVAEGLAWLQGMGFATQADLEAAVEPLATRAQLEPLATRAQLATLQAQVTALAQQVAQLSAQLQALLAPNAPAIAAAASATVQATAAARAKNAHDRSAEPYAVVPRADGTLPPNWPAAFDRAGLRGPIAAVDALLNDYGLAVPHGATALARRDALALYIGAIRV